MRVKLNQKQAYKRKRHGLSVTKMGHFLFSVSLGLILCLFYGHDVFGREVLDREWPFQSFVDRDERPFQSPMDFPHEFHHHHPPVSSSEDNLRRPDRPRSQRIPAAVLPLGQDVRVVVNPQSRAVRVGSASSASSVSVSSSISSNSRPNYLREYAFLATTSPSVDHRPEDASITAPESLSPKEIVERTHTDINASPSLDINTPDPRFINRNFRLQQRPPQRFSPPTSQSLPSSFPVDHDHHHLLEVDSPPATSLQHEPASPAVNQYLSNARRYSNSQNPDSVDRQQTRREQSQDRRLLQKQQEEARLREEWSRIEEKRLEEERIMADKNEAERRRQEAEENERRDGLLRSHERAREAAQRAKEEDARIREEEPRVRVQNARRPQHARPPVVDHTNDDIPDVRRHRPFESGRTNTRQPKPVEHSIPDHHLPIPSIVNHPLDHEEEHFEREPQPHVPLASVTVATTKPTTTTTSTTTTTTTTTTVAPPVSVSTSNPRLPRPAGRPGGRRFIGRHKITNPNDRPPLYKPTPPSTTTTTKKPNDEEYEDEYEEYEDTTTTTQKPKRKRKRTTTPASTTTTTLSPGYRERPDGRIIDFKADPNFPHELKGVDLTEYPFYVKIPDTVSFSCKGRHDGYYADVEHHCQIYHHCAIENRYDFLCPNYTLFDQTTFTCRFINTVNCGQSAKHFNRNNDLYVESTTPDPQESRRFSENSRSNSGRRKKKNNNANNNSPSRDSSNSSSRSTSSSDTKPRNFFNNRRNSDNNADNGRTNANSNQNNDNNRQNNTPKPSNESSSGQDDKNGNNNNNHSNADGDEGAPDEEDEEAK